MGRPRTDIQPRILHSARARFLADGVEGASLRTIAKDARTNIGMVFYYYPSKDDLFLAVVEEVYARLVGELEELLAGDTPLRGKLERVFVRLGHASDEEADVVRLVLREGLVFSERFRKIVARFRRGHIALLMRAFSESQESGEIGATLPLPILLTSTFAVGVAPQIVRRVLSTELGFGPLLPAEPLASLLAATLFDGIGAKSGPAPKKASAKKASAKKKTSTSNRKARTARRPVRAL